MLERDLHLVPGRGVVRRGEYDGVRQAGQRLARQDVKLQDAFYLVVEELNAQRLLLFRRGKDLQRIPLGAERPPGEVDVVALVLDVHEGRDGGIAVDLHAGAK